MAVPPQFRKGAAKKGAPAKGAVLRRLQKKEESYDKKSGDVGSKKSEGEKENEKELNKY